MTRYDNKAKFGKMHYYFMFDQEACPQCKARDKKWIWIGCSLKGNTETDWRRAETNPVNEPLCLSNDFALLAGIQFPNHISKYPVWLKRMMGLETISFAGCGRIESLPFEHFVKLPFLRSLDLTGCVLLWSIPQEICSQGGKVVMQFLREVKRNGNFNTNMNLFLVGEGEVGKTSVIMALQSYSSRAAYIRADHRTVGIDITTWTSEWGTVFRTFDLAGQQVYAKTHQYFLLRRALYLFIWRALPGLSTFENLKKSIRFWLESLQNRMPGSYVMLAVTHIDQVDADALQTQIDFVQTTVGEWLIELDGRVLAGSMPVLKVWNQGRSIPVDCLSGKGVPQLKECLQLFSSDMPWYNEALPSTWIALQDILVVRRVRDKYISVDEYKRLASKAGVSERGLHMVTQYFHESGLIQYFGDLSQPKPAGGESSDFLNDFVFISGPWMMSVMKGLLCHERQALMDFFSSKQDREMLLQLSVLRNYGILSKELLPFLWPSPSQCPQFWEFLCSKAKRERALWKEGTISNQGDLECALAVLGGFDQLVAQGDVYLVPGALAPAQFPCTPVLDVDECPYRLVFHYPTLPPGALDSIFIRMTKSGCRCAQITPFMAVFYDRAGDLCQIFCFEEQGDPYIQKLVLRSSSKLCLVQAEQQVSRMEKQFGGLQRRHRSEREQNSELMSTKAFIWKMGAKVFYPSPEIVCTSCVSSHQRNAHVFKKAEFLKDWQQVFLEGQSLEYIVCPACNWSHKLLDILTTCSVSDSERRQCPCCQHFGNVTNSFFSSGESRLLLNLSSKGERDEKTITCYECMHRGRVGQIQVLDLVQEELFVSGLSTLNQNLQLSVGNCLRQIEIQANVGWCDRLDSLKGSLVVILLLSDAYLHSEQCIQEFISAFRSRQAIIPIILPDAGIRNEQGISVGWTGSACSDYWKHAVGMDSDDQAVDWSLLRHFSPIQFPLALLSDKPTKQELVEFSRKVGAIIEARIQRDKSTTFPDMPIAGVRLSYFDKFIQQFGGESNFLGLTTEQVMHRFVKPATAQTRLSLCELLVSQGLESEVGKSEWFYSHACKSFFLDTVSALKSYFEGSGTDPVIWFDVFSVSHHKTDNRPFEWWNTVFLSLIGNIGNVLLLLQPYADPRSGTSAWISLTRLWCVYEIYAGAITLSRFDVVMTKEMSDRFLSDLHADPESVLSILGSFDCANCVASSKEDEERVFEVITKSAGFPALNSTVMGVMEQWLYGVLLSPESRERPQQGGQPALVVMETICTRGLQLREQRLGPDHADTANSRRILEAIRRAQTDAAFLDSLVEKGWRAHELEEFQREQDAKTAEEERILRQRADDIARLVAEEEREGIGARRAADAAKEAERKREIEEEAMIRQKAAESAAKEERRTKDNEKERGGALTPARPAAPHAAQAKPKCCSIA